MLQAAGSAASPGLPTGPWPVSCRGVGETEIAPEAVLRAVPKLRNGGGEEFASAYVAGLNKDDMAEDHGGPTKPQDVFGFRTFEQFAVPAIGMALPFLREELKRRSCTASTDNAPRGS